jgi:hypothetical protein
MADGLPCNKTSQGLGENKTEEGKNLSCTLGLVGTSSNKCPSEGIQGIWDNQGRVRLSDSGHLVITYLIQSQEWE